jgi:hypothetical protein
MKILLTNRNLSACEDLTPEPATAERARATARPACLAAGDGNFAPDTRREKD